MGRPTNEKSLLPVLRAGALTAWLSAFFLGLLPAQQAPNAPSTPNLPNSSPQQSNQLVAQQNPTELPIDLQERIKQTAATAEKQAQVLLEQATERDARTALTRQLHAKQKAFHEGVENGQIDPFADLRAKLPELQASTERLEALQGALQSPNLSPEHRADFNARLFNLLQEVGQWLEPANEIAEDGRLNQEQAQTLQALINAEKGPGEADQVPFELVNPELTYLFQHIALPVMVKTKPGTRVYWDSPNGGRFTENGLALYSSVADENGIARATWLSRGSAAGTSRVLVTTPEHTDILNAEIEVVGLEIIALDRLTSFKPAKAPQVPAVK